MVIMALRAGSIGGGGQVLGQATSLSLIRDINQMVITG